jgi:hypothetical protein
MEEPVRTSLVVAMEEEEEEVGKISRAAMEEEEKTSQAAMEEEDKTSQAAMEEEVDKTSQAAMEEEEDKARRVAAMALAGVISLQQQDTQILRKLLALGTPQALINTDRTRRPILRRVPLTTRRRGTITKRRLQAVLSDRQLWAPLVMRHMNISRTRVTKDSSRAGATNKQFGTPKKEREQNSFLIRNI